MDWRLRRNIPKMFWFSLTHRRHYIPILSLLFVAQPSLEARQLGIYMLAGSITAFFMEIPSGYLADRVGHKRTLVLSKLFLLISTTLFLLAHGLALFVLGSIFLSLSFAFLSGTQSAFVHNTLYGLRREKEYTKVMSKIGANASGFSVVLLALLPLFTKISLSFPLIINLAFDAAGLFLALSLAEPPQERALQRDSFKSIFNDVKAAARPGFLPATLLVGAIGGFLLAESPYRSVLLVGFGFPVVLIGMVMAASRIVWFGVGHYAHVLEQRVGFMNLLRLEVLLLPLLYLLAVLSKNPYVAGALIAIAVGYRWGRQQIVTNHFLTRFISSPRLKATMLSIIGQVEQAVQALLAVLFYIAAKQSLPFSYLVFIGVFFATSGALYLWLARRACA